MMNRILYGKKEHIAWIAVRDPNGEKETKAGSCLNEEIKKAAEMAEKDRNVYALIITDAFPNTEEDQGFFDFSFPDEGMTGEETPRTATAADCLKDLRIPVIAAVNERVEGEWQTLVMACDIRIAGEDARIILKDGTTFTAREARDNRMVNSVFAPDELQKEAMELAHQISRNAPIAVQEIKKCVNVGMAADMHTGLEFEQQAFSLCNSTQDKVIGMSAFLNQEEEKRFINR